jgi:hypothetical protein
VVAAAAAAVAAMAVRTAMAIVYGVNGAAAVTTF